MSALIRFDGASRGNGKPNSLAGAGAVIYQTYYIKEKEEKDGKVIEITRKKTSTTKLSKFLGKGAKYTNNYAEYSSLLIGLEKTIELGIKNVAIEGDSQLVIKQLKGEYQVKSPNIKPLFKKIKELEKNFDEITYKHIYRNLNGEADALANKAIDERFLK